MLLLLLKLCAAFCVFHLVSSQGITCKSETGSSTDWFINYKLPKLEQYGRGSSLGRGSAYAYLLPSSRRWIMSSEEVTSASSMMGNTLGDFYNKQNLTYLLYNDESPVEADGSSVGHTKGAVVFGGGSGFWLIHSVPKFPDENEYNYPTSGLENGQSVLCVTYDISTLNEIGKQLLYNGPNIYAKHLSSAEEGVLDEDVKSLFSSRPKFVRKAPFTRTANLRSQRGTKIISFAKDNQFNDDLYSALIAPGLQSSLFVETWRRGSGTKLNPSCQSDYHVYDVTSLNMTIVQGRQTRSIPFSSMEDHSKWTVSEDPKYICIGDINRMESQKKRGGGAACLSTRFVWQAFHTSIKDSDDCPI